MFFIDRKDIERWGSLATSKSEMAELVMQLVINSLPNAGNKYDMPIGSSTFIGGWDGVVDSEAGTSFIPAGKSGWEFGARQDIPAKPNEDYDKRTKETPDEKRSQMTFVFVTPFYWGDKDNWVQAKKKEGKWRDVIAYDSDSLSQWMYRLPIVTEWFARKINLFTDSGIVLPQVQWKGISIGRNGIVLTPNFYIVGRERIVSELKEIINGAPRLKAYRASSREEAMAFIIAAGMSLPEPTRSKFMGKTIVVDSRDSFRRMAYGKNAINIVTHLEDNSDVYSAAAQNIVLVSLGPDDVFPQDVTELPVSNGYALIEELVSYNIPETEARRIVMTNSCNLTLIRKELGFPPAGAKRIGKEELNDLKPALLLGRWNENYDADKTLLCSISGVKYDKYQASLNQWLKQSVSPLTKTGSVWRLTSPLALWADISEQLDEDFFKSIKKIFDSVFKGAGDKCSDHLKEGLLQTLIILSLYGDRLGLPIDNSQDWVDSLIRQLLHDAIPEKWVEFSDQLPMIAEASPKVFIGELNLAIKEKTPVITALFEEKNGFLYPQSHHTSLLWALEALAWHPDYLESVTKILLSLTEMDPGGRLSNRPFNSLVDIYLPWKPHTSVGLRGRLCVLDKCMSDGYPVMWKLLIAMLPHPGAATSGTYKLKWRDYELTEEQKYDPTNVYKTTEWVVSKLMSLFDGEDLHLSSLIGAMEPIDWPLRHQLIMWLPDAVKAIVGSNKETRKALRETLWYQNLSGIKDRYVFTQEETEAVITAYKITTPEDLKERYSWLFDEYYPHLPDKSDCDEEDIYVNARQTERLRKEACEELINKLGVDEVITLKDAVKEPQTLGSTLALFSNDSITVKVCKLLVSEKDIRFAKGYVSSLEGQKGEGLISSLYENCKKEGFTNDDLTSLLLCFDYNKKLWHYIDTLDDDVRKSYWKNVPAIFWGGYKEDVTLYIIDKLASVGRGLDAMNNSWIYAKEMPTVAIQNLLQNVLRSNKELNDSIDHHPLSVFIEQLHERADVNKDLLQQLEWIYLPILRYDRVKNNLALLNDRLVNDANFVVELLSYLYKPDKEESITESGEETYQEKNVNDEDRQNALRAFYLFNQWNKIPGVGANYSLDEIVLKNWLQEVLQKAKDAGHYRNACSQLGQLFSHFPERTEDAEKLFELIEPIEEKSFFSSYNVGLFNKRGLTSRGPYEGGEIEYDNAKMFKELYDKYHKRFPKVAKVFKDLSEQYLRMAKQRDDEADITKLDY